MNSNCKIIGFITLMFSFTFSGSQIQAQTIGFALKEGEKEIVIPFESFNNLIVVPVLLNNKIPLKFILDTGVQTTILTDRTFSDLLNIQYHRKLTLYGADGDTGVDAYVAANVTLELPGTVGKGQVMLVLEEDYLQLKNYLGEQVHGILGYEIFRRFVVEINYEDKTLTLYEPTAFKPHRSFSVLPITIEETKPYFYAEIKQKDNTTVTSKLMIDTGASHSLLLDFSSHELLHLPEKKIRCNLGRGLGGDIDGYIGRIDKISFDEFELEDVISSYPDTASLGVSFQNTGRQGTLGAGILKRFTVIIDYYTNKLYLKKNRKYKEAFEYNMSGLEFIALGVGLNIFKVQSIRKDSPADRAGIMEGDIIKRINGINSDNLDLNSLNSYFRIKEGKKIKLKILRNDEILLKKFRLERLI